MTDLIALKERLGIGLEFFKEWFGVGLPANEERK